MASKTFEPYSKTEEHELMNMLKIPLYRIDYTLDKNIIKILKEEGVI